MVVMKAARGIISPLMSLLHAGGEKQDFSVLCVHAKMYKTGIIVMARYNLKTRIARIHL